MEARACQDFKSILWEGNYRCVESSLTIPRYQIKCQSSGTGMAKQIETKNTSQRNYALKWGTSSDKGEEAKMYMACLDSGE